MNALQEDTAQTVVAFEDEDVFQTVLFGCNGCGKSCGAATNDNCVVYQIATGFSLFLVCFLVATGFFVVVVFFVILQPPERMGGFWNLARKRCRRAW